MNFYKLYLISLCVVLTTCNTGSNKKPQRLVKHVVYLINHPEVVPVKIQKDTSYLEYLFQAYPLINIRTLDSGIHVDLKYSGKDNFLKKDFYDGLRNAYFPCEVALKICNAQSYLRQINPAYSLCILDAARPLHVQQMMWDSLQMPADKKFNYLAPPYSVSLHNYGCAVDLTIINIETDSMLDMGSQFDHFEKLSEPVYEWKYLKSGELSQQAFNNRKLLRKVMQSAGLNPINSEWWHFNFCTKEYAALNFKLIK